jgi:hypothetical protein
MVRQSVSLLAAVLLVSACHTITEELPGPSTPSQVAGGPAPIPVVVVPVPVITQPPAPTPTPNANPANPSNPTPAPTANPNPPSSRSCSLGRGNGSGNGCPYERARFQEDVERAIDNAIRNNPGLFDMRDNRCPQGCPFVRNTDGYWNAVTNEMQRLGYCATHDGEELAVKNSNSFNDQYDIISGDGYIRRGAGSYRSTCYPAWF